MSICMSVPHELYRKYELATCYPALLLWRQEDGMDQEWLETLERLKGFQERLLRTLHGIARRDLFTAEAPGKWSIAQVVGHLGDLELVTAVRIRKVLTEDVPPLPSFDQNGWATAHLDASLDDLLEHLWFVRRRNVALLESLTDGQLDRAGLHAEFGTMSVRDIARRIASHQDRHLAQIERIKEGLALSATDSPSLEGMVWAEATSSPIRDRAPGIRIRDLWRNGSRRALHVEVEAGARWPELDYHVPGPEEVYVLSGTFDDGVRLHPAGTFIHHPAGSSHRPTSPDGCTLLVYYPEG
jgi:hypothetical protein